MGEHTTTYIKQARAKYEPIELVVDRPKQLPSVSTLIADIPAPRQITSIRPTPVFLSEDSSTKLDMQLDSHYHQEHYDEMELVFEKPIVRDSSTTLLANIQPGRELKSIQATPQVEKRTIEESSSSFTLQRERESEEELVELRLRKPHVQDSSSVLLASIQPELGLQGRLKASPYLPQPTETSTTALTMELNQRAEVTPFELIIPRLDMESSTSTILAQVSPTIAGLRALIDVPSVEKSTSSFVLDQKRRHDQEIELVMPKPKRLETSTSTMLADVQAKLETKHIRPTEIQPEAATSTFYFDETTSEIIPQPVELRIKQPVVDDSSSTVFANVKATINTEQTHVLGASHTSYEHSSSAFLLDTRPEADYPSEVELILPRPQVQESTSVIFADVRPTLDTSHKHLVLPPSLPLPVKSSSEMIIEQTPRDTAPVELHLHRQPSSHTVSATVDDALETHRETYILGINRSQDQQYGYQVADGSPVLHVDRNQPVELVFNVDEGSSSATSPQFRRDYNSRTLNSNTSGIDSGSNFITGQLWNQASNIFCFEPVGNIRYPIDILLGNEPRQYQPVEFLVSGGSGGYNSNVDQYSTGGTGGYTTTRTTTTTTTRRLLNSSDTGGYNETTNTSAIRGIRPYDQVDLVLQPDSSLSSSSKVLTTTVGLDQGHVPYFVLSLRDQSVREGESVLFEVIVSGMSVRWRIIDLHSVLLFGRSSTSRENHLG